MDEHHRSRSARSTEECRARKLYVVLETAGETLPILRRRYSRIEHRVVEVEPHRPSVPFGPGRFKTHAGGVAEGVEMGDREVGHVAEVLDLTKALRFPDHRLSHPEPTGACVEHVERRKGATFLTRCDDARPDESVGLRDPCGNGVRSRQDAILHELGNRSARAIGAERPRVIRAGKTPLRVDGAKGEIDTTMRALASNSSERAIASAPQRERSPEQFHGHH